MQFKKRHLVLLLAIGMVVGWLTLGGSAYVMTATSSQEFCVSCHTMQIPFEEYQGSMHYSNSKGIRAECADCHIPKPPLDYVISKIRATKDVYHEFVTGKIDTEKKFEEHRAAMAETVWAKMRKNDSITCRSCHTLDAMDTYEQSAEAVKNHEFGVETGQTCIDCHKGVAHFPPLVELDSAAFDNLRALTTKTKPKAELVYPIESIAMGDLGSINPATKLTVAQVKDGVRTVEINAYQMKGAEQVLYAGLGQRSIVATLSEAGISAVDAGEYVSDEYGNEWRTAHLTAEIDAPVLDKLDPLWDYAEELDTVYCSTCHAKIAAHHYTTNAWGPIAKGMGDRTDISNENLEILTKYLQTYAKDMVGH